MRMNKAIKRIVALGTGITMVGATILGAMAAADLSQYPAPFVANGAFNALIVVGAAAASSDVLGSVDIATSLQYANTVTKAVPGSAETQSVVGEGAKVEISNSFLNLNESLASVKTQFDSSDLPTLLAKGTYVNDGDDQATNYDYTQKLAFGSGSAAQVTWLRDNDYTDDANPYVLLYGPKSSGGTYFMKYTLDFTKLAESKWYSGTTCGTANELCDFEGTKITILGKEYEVTKAERSGAAITWEMMGGLSLNTMNEGETKTFTVDGKDYEVTVDIIGSSSPATAVLTINGQSTKELEKDQTDKVAGIEIGMKKVISKSGGGMGLVQFYLGAEKVVLSDDDDTVALDTNAKLGSTTVDDLYADWTVSAAAAAVKLQKLELTWAPSDKLFIPVGGDATFPGLESFKVSFGGLSPDPAKAEKIVVKADGSNKIQLSAPLEGGDTTFDVLYSNDVNFSSYGKSATAGSGILFLSNSGDMTEGDYALLSDSSARESHVIQLKSVSTANLTKVYDITSKETYESTCLAGANCTINVGNTKVIFSAVSNAAGTATLTTGGSVSNAVYTADGMTISLGTAGAINDATHAISFREESATGDLNAGDQFSVTADVNTDGKTTITTVTATSPFVTAAGQALSPGFEYGDTAKYGYMTPYGTLILHYTEPAQEYVEVFYPDTQEHAQVFVNTAAAQVVNGGGSTYQEVQKIEVGAAVLDTEVADLKAQNTIVVGGPCVNTLAAELMGSSSSDCAAGFVEGTGVIKLFDEGNGKVALLVAGYSAMDTRRAARVVANYKDYSNFAGTELAVTGTSLSDIKVGVPTPAAPEVPATQ